MPVRILALLNQRYEHLCRRLASRHDLVVNPTTYDFIRKSGGGSVASLETLFDPGDLAAIDRYVLEKSPEDCARLAMGFEAALSERGYADVKIYESLAPRFSNLSRQMLGIAVAVKRMAVEGGLGLLMVDNDVRPLQRVAIQLARAYGVPSLCLAHGLPGLANLHDRVYADIMSVFGERCRNWYRRAGVAEDRLAVTGSVVMDLHYRLRGEWEKSRALREIGLQSGLPVVCLATTWRSGLYLREHSYRPGDVMADTFRALARAQKARAFQLVLKPHPSDPYADKEYEALAQAEGLRVHSTYPRHLSLAPALAPLLRASDVVICFQSTMAVEALIYGARVMSLSLHVPETIFNDAASILKARTEEEVFRKTMEALRAPRTMEEEMLREADLLTLNALNDGRATDRVCALVDAMTATSNEQRATRSERGATSEGPKEPSRGPLDSPFATHHLPLP
ncbi:MAG: hypothetical protein HYT87_00935 [Nitrospirae bacterium]|nr:hypothetical protein [Nitrospirota bacterium]